MDAKRFDQIAKSLSSVGTRRGVLPLVAALPFAAALSALLEEESEAGRRRRHKARHDPGGDKNNRKGKRKGRRKPKCATAGRRPKKGKPCCKSLVLDDAGRCGGCAATGCGPCQRCDSGSGQCVTTCPAYQTCKSGTCQCDVCASGCQFTSVRVAVDAASPGDTIHICPGTYQNAPGTRLTLNKNVTLVGAGDGVGGTTLLGAGGINPVISVFSTTTAVALEGLMITGGQSNGGGIQNTGALTMTDCTVAGNTGSVGAGIHNATGTLTMIGCTVTENEATIDGGGIYNEDNGTVILNATTVTLNEANIGGGGGSGGGIFNQSGTVTLQNGSSVTGNAPDNCAPPGSVPNCAG